MRSKTARKLSSEVCIWGGREGLRLRLLWLVFRQDGQRTSTSSLCNHRDKLTRKPANHREMNTVERGGALLSNKQSAVPAGNLQQKFVAMNKNQIRTPSF